LLLQPAIVFSESNFHTSGGNVIITYTLNSTLPHTTTSLDVLSSGAQNAGGHLGYAHGDTLVGSLPLIGATSFGGPLLPPAGPAETVSGQGGQLVDQLSLILNIIMKRH